jgi:hypothetical protein
MADKEKDDKRVTARVWMERIKRSLRYRDKEKKRQEWARLEKEYSGEYDVKVGGTQAPPINLVFGYVDTASSRIYFRDPHMTINPKGKESIGAARIMELDTNYAFKSLKVKRSIKQTLIDALVVAHGWIKLGYVSETGQRLSEPGTEPAEYIKNEEIFMSYVPWEDIVFDTAMSKMPPYDCRWIAHRIVKPLDEMKRDHNYTNTGRLDSNVKSRDSKDAQDKNKDEQQAEGDDSELFEFWEITDLDTKKVYCVCDQSDKYLREDDYKYEMSGLNYSMLAFNRVNNKPYPISDVFLIEPQILERIKLRAAQLNHIKRWGRQLSVEEGAVTKEEMEKFSQGVDGAVIQRRKGSAPPAPIEYAALQQEIFAIDNFLQSDMDAVIGQSDLDRGAPPKTNAKTTKYQLQEQNQGTSVRQNSKQDTLEDFLEEITDKYISLVKQFQDIPKYVRITGMKPEQIVAQFQSIPGVTIDQTGIKFTKESIKGEFEVEAKAGSTLPLNRENKIRLLDTTLEKGQAMGIVPGSPIGNAVRKALLRELDIAELEVACDEQEAMEKQAQQQAAMAPKQPQGPPPHPVQHHVHHSGPPARPHPQGGANAGPLPPPSMAAQ